MDDYMSNPIMEFIFIFIGFFVCISISKRNDVEKCTALSYYKILNIFSFIACSIIVESLDRGAMLFGDGYDYYKHALNIINVHEFTMQTMFNPK